MELSIVSLDGKKGESVKLDDAQRKFAKHGLGELPGGWAAALRARHEGGD